MSTGDILYMLIGLLFGSTLLACGFALGAWVTKRNGSEGDSTARLQELLTFAKTISAVTNDFAGDFSNYQTTLQSISKRADAGGVTTKAELQQLLKQISDANAKLQLRLDSAEKKLESQTEQLEGYLTEARTDGLTGLANRRAFDQKMDEQYAKWMQTKQPFSLALVDIDFFKKINDTYGHPAGDAVLREIGRVLQEYSNDAVLVARYGGEEFALMFTGKAEEAGKTMEGIRAEIQSRAIAAEGHTISVTISSGVSHIVADERVNKLVRRSDEALYSAKLGGRNRIFIHSGKICQLYGNPGKPATEASASTGAGNKAEQGVEPKIRARLDGWIAEEAKQDA